MSESDSPLASLSLSRRQLLGAGGTATVLAASGIAVTGALGSSAVGAATKNPYPEAAHFLLNGANQGMLSAVEGGNIVITPNGSLRVESVNLTCNPGAMRKTFFQWADACLRGQATPQQGSAEIVFADAIGKGIQSLRLVNPRATALLVQALNQAEAPNSDLLVSLTIEAGAGEYQIHPGTAVPALASPGTRLTQQFALFIEGLEDATRHSEIIAGLGIRTARSAAGVSRRCDPLTFFLRSANAQPLHAWFEQWYQGARQPRQGLLQFFDPTRKKAAVSVNLLQLRPVSIGGLRKIRDDGIPMTEVTVQPDDLKFNLGSILPE